MDEKNITERTLRQQVGPSCAVPASFSLQLLIKQILLDELNQTAPGQVCLVVTATNQCCLISFSLSMNASVEMFFFQLIVDWPSTPVNVSILTS